MSTFQVSKSNSRGAINETIVYYNFSIKGHMGKVLIMQLMEN